MKKLSELMREGAKLHPQCTGDFADFGAENNIISTCAIGAAAVAAHQIFPRMKVDFEDPDDVYRVIKRACGTDLHQKVSVQQEIVKLNDDEGETREAIADWLASIDL